MNLSIVVVGDSFTWGFGVNDGEIYTDILEKLLNDTEVINLGVTAYGLSQEIKYFKILGKKFSPDILIVALVMNDIQQDFYNKTTKNLRNSNISEQKKENKGSFFLKIKKILAENLVIYKIIIEIINTKKNLVQLLVTLGLKDELSGFDELDTNLSPGLKNYPSILEHSFQKIERKLLSLKQETDKIGVKLIVALVPSLQAVVPKAFSQSIAYTQYYPQDFDLDKPYKRLQAFGQNYGIEIMSPLVKFRDMQANGHNLYLKRDMHFNKNGHMLFAHELAKVIKQK